ncbi:protein lifeguard 3-like [Schistocerca serialis cubense]|uniref:protein lifeguard 3-like n=1 Tax=Schistocerca serialis cubense TaxID=2023355 RepID=UPI00214ECF39|nr:protein lifeguard 3-like [Schistocerca serialis cubense]
MSATDAHSAGASKKAGGDSRNAAPACRPPPPTAAPSAGDAGIAEADKQQEGGGSEAPSAAPAAVPPGDPSKESDRDSSRAAQRPGATPVVYVRVPVGEQYPPPGYSRDAAPYGGGWGSRRGGDGGGGGGGRWPTLRDDAEWDDAGWFSAAAVRRAFIRKVYSVLSLQLALTVGIIALFVFDVLVTAYVGFMVTYLVLVCCGDVRRRHPCNLILLFIFTLSFAYMLGVISAFHSTYIVFMAAAVTAVVCLLVTLVATFSKVDITGCGALLCVLGIGVLIFGVVLVLVFLIWGPSSLLLAVYAGLVGVVFSLYLMFDTQLIMGGRYMELSPDEYVYATLMLYVDIANIFWAMLTLFGYCCGE